MLFDSLDIEERLPSKEGQRAASWQFVNWVEEVDCVTHICEDIRLVVLAFWYQLGIAHRSSLTNHRYVKETSIQHPCCWIDSSYSSHSIKDFGRFPPVSLPTTIWFSVWTLAVVGCSRKIFSLTPFPQNKIILVWLLLKYIFACDS